MWGKSTECDSHTFFRFFVITHLNRTTILNKQTNNEKTHPQRYKQKIDITLVGVKFFLFCSVDKRANPDS